MSMSPVLTAVKRAIGSGRNRITILSRCCAFGFQKCGFLTKVMLSSCFHSDMTYGPAPIGRRLTSSPDAAT